MSIENMTTDEIINAFKSDFPTLMNQAAESRECRQAVADALNGGSDPKAVRASVVAGVFMAWFMLKKKGVFA